MSARCIGHCGRDCNAGQGRHRCAQCPGRRQFVLPAALRPLGNRTLATLIVAVLAALALAGCGGGDPEDFDAGGNPAPAEARKTIQPPDCGASGVCQ